MSAVLPLDAKLIAKVLLHNIDQMWSNRIASDCSCIDLCPVLSVRHPFTEVPTTQALNAAANDSITRFRPKLIENKFGRHVIEPQQRQAHF